MYNSYQQPSPFGRPPDYGSFPGAPPAMGAPPGMAAPGTAAPPGMQQGSTQQPGTPSGFPPNFQLPANMPNINFSAPVIRLGTSGPSKPDVVGSRDDRERGGRRPGLGSNMHTDSRPMGREPLAQLIPPTKEEVIRTVFVGGITEGAGGDEGVERILRAAGNLRRWSRATDADDKPCKFGFAEYEDPESLSTAVEVLRDVEVPLKRQMPQEVKSEDEGETEKSRLLIIVDDNSLTYLQQWEESGVGPDPSQTQMRLDHARSALQAVLSDLAHPSVPTQRDEMSGIDRDGDLTMEHSVPDGSSAEIVTIPITVDDELSDIPADMRETVAKEIASFRDRSTRRDLERLKQEEEIEFRERARSLSGVRPNRLASPPIAAPSGPAGGLNGIPVGPRERPLNAPSGPKAFGQQIPRDYQKGVSFINGTGNSSAIASRADREDEESEASDEELEQRRKAKRDAELEKQYLDQERRWLNRERSRTAAVEREKNRDKEEDGKAGGEKEATASRLKEWNDDVELSRKTEQYYSDRSMWIRNRAVFRSREVALDDTDRAAEDGELARDHQQRERAGAMADEFLSRQADEMEIKGPDREPQRFKLSFGAAAQKAQTAAQPRRTAFEVEGLLEDEEEADSREKRTLVPIQFDSAAEAAGLTEEERAQAAKQLAQDIPTDKEGLWRWAVKWDFVDEAVIGEQLKPFVEKKIMEYLGVQEQMLVDVVESHLRKRGGPQELVEQLEGALDEEAEVLVKKLWRMVIFFSESEKRGLSA